ncbi:DEAD/DEAH box helicase [Sulfobacillus thermosulfidooxidans]|uniref:DEAD/DEAH box helicase n=1 Tax=Sulfobacillus thermosulfidooxidans TaxID=28034 RepID=UPI000A05C4CC|nr:DEAD/DEAH box helicase [Sulfobacillus thermosulfidooxidans]
MSKFGGRNRHHIGAVTYQRLLAALDLDRATAPASRVLLGITATPFRTDGQSLHQFFDTVAYRKEIADLIPLGYLAPIRGLRVYSPVALPDPTQTDFDEADLALAVDTPGRNTLIVETWQKHAADRHTVVFAVNVAHARHLAEAFQTAGIAADWIAGSLPLTERRRRLQAFHDRQIQVLVNCTILTEGWDEPAVNCLVMARPTMSPGLYIQMVGRGLRPHPGKTDCLVLDVTDRQHSLSTCTLDLIAQPDPAQKPRKRRADAPPIRADHEPADIAGRVDLIPLPWDLLGTSPFVWHPDVDGPWLEAGPNIRIQCRPLGSELFEVWLFDHRQRTRLSDQPLPFAYAQGLAEDWVRAQKWTGYAAKDAAWRSRRVSPKQQAILDRLHIPYDPATLTQEAASRLIRDATDHQPATAKQRRWLAAHQIPIPEGLTRQEASTLISAHGARDAPADAASSSAPSSP